MVSLQPTTKKEETKGKTRETGLASKPKAKQSDARAELWDVVCVAATSGAFAALRGDGAVVTWGDAQRGGDSRQVGTDSEGGDGVSWKPPRVAPWDAFFF